MPDPAREWFRINAMAAHVDLLIAFLTIHFGVYPVARGIGENLERFVESFLFRSGEVGT